MDVVFALAGAYRRLKPYATLYIKIFYFVNSIKYNIFGETKGKAVVDWL
jgi:hypothetical protein